jgi:hypothetical protein
MAQQPIVGQCLVNIEASRSHSNTSNSVGLLWTIDQPDAEGPLTDKTQHSQETDIHSPAGIRTRNPSKRATLGPRLRPRGHRNRQYVCVYVITFSFQLIANIIVNNCLLFILYTYVQYKLTKYTF